MGSPDVARSRRWSKNSIKDGVWNADTVAMTSYLHAWWYGSTTTREEPQRTLGSRPPSLFNVSLLESSAPTPVPIPDVSMSISSPEETQAAIDMPVEADSIEDDIPPAFPSSYSIQRSSGSLQAASAGSDQGIMPPPPLPSAAHSSASRDGNNRAILSTTRLSRPATANATFLQPPSSSNTLRVPSISRGSTNSLKPPPTTTRAPQPSSKRKKAVLEPGHSPLDWAALKASGEDLRGTPALMRIPPSQLKVHNRRDDAWTAINGKVYNITPYLAFHPGGVAEIMRVAGRDGTKLFALTHAWVNVEFMLDECMVGFLVPEPSLAA